MDRALTHSAATPSRQSLLDELLSPGGLFAAAVLLLSLFPVTSAIRDPDFWWHLRAGQLIIARGSLLGHDPFTYTVSTHAWTMHEWLTEVVYALLQRAAGLAPIVLLLSAVTWLGLVCIALRSRLGVRDTFALGAGLLLAAMAGYPIWGPRVQMVTFCFSALTLLLLERHLRRGGRAIWVLPPLFCLWSNLHSGFVIGLGFIALVLVAEAAAPALGFSERVDPKRLRTLLFVLIASTLAGMINPNGPGIVFYALLTQTSGAQQSLILEWHSPDFHDWVLLPFGVMLVSLLVMAACNRRMRARDAVLALATIALALQSVRHVALFIAACTPLWIEQLHLVLQRRRSIPARPPSRPPLLLRATVLGVIAALLLGAYAVGRLGPVLAVQPGSLAYAEEFPVCAARWLAQAPQPLRIFNQYGEGGYLADQLSAKGDRVFIFGDAALMGDALLYRYADVESVQPDWDSIIESSGTDIVLFDRNTPLAIVMSHSIRWTRVYEDPLSIAFVRTTRLASLRLPPVPTSYPASDPCAQLSNTALNPEAQNQ